MGKKNPQQNQLKILSKFMLTYLLFLVASTGNSQIQRILKPEVKNLPNLLVNTFTKKYLGNKSCDLLDCLKYTYNWLLQSLKVCFFFFFKYLLPDITNHRYFLPSNSLQECFASTILHVYLFLIEMVVNQI